MNFGKLCLMFKGALPPTVAIALYQLDGFAFTFPTLGYLVAIMSILSMAILPRAKFIQNLMFNILGICVGSCFALLTCYCALEARLRTSTPTSSSAPGSSGAQQALEYNSSASAVAGVWLFVNICFANSARFFRPQLNIPIIMYSIFATISGTYAAVFANMAQAIAFVKQLMEAFLSGFGIATVIHFLVFPVTSRHVVFTEMNGYVDLLKKLMVCKYTYLKTMADVPSSSNKEEADDTEKDSRKDQAVKDLQETFKALSEIHGKLRGDLVFAKREAALGYLNGAEIGQIAALLRQIFLPFVGLTSVVDIFERLVEGNAWSNDGPNNGVISSRFQRAQEIREAAMLHDWASIAASLRPPYQMLSEAMTDGLTHVCYSLKLRKPPKSKVTKDPENCEERPRPGESSFASYLEAKIRDFSRDREGALRVWCSQRGFKFPKIATQQPPTPKLGEENPHIDEKSRQQLYLILYMEHLIQAAGCAVLDLVRFADDKVESGVMRRRRFIRPRWKTIRKWVMGAFNGEEASSTDSGRDGTGGNLCVVELGDAFKARKDPEHLPPSSIRESVGDQLRRLSGLLSSDEVGFGFRVACATMSIAVMAYIEQTQVFFFQQRVVWALIMISIGMTMTTGSGAFGLFARVVGTVVATACALLIWYIAGGQGFPGAVIPVLFMFLFLEYYAFIFYQQYIVVVIITLVTQILIIGYELEAGKIGPERISANGQEYYPVYFLSLYRLAAVSGGCFVAWIWTYFPYPITARTTLRQQLGETVYLLANYYSVVHTLSSTRLSGQSGDPKDKKSPGARLEKEGVKLIAKIMGLIVQLREHERFISFELTLGGKFPREQYRTLIQECAK